MARGVRHGRHYLEKGCEHTARSLSPTVECEHTTRPLSPIRKCKYTTRSLSPTMECEDTARPLSPTIECEPRLLSPTVECKHMAWPLSPTGKCKHTARPLSPTVVMYKNLPSLWEHVLDIDLHDMLRKNVSSSALPFIYGLTTDVWISCYFVDHVLESWL